MHLVHHIAKARRLSRAPQGLRIMSSNEQRNDSRYGWGREMELSCASLPIRPPLPDLLRTHVMEIKTRASSYGLINCSVHMYTPVILLAKTSYISLTEKNQDRSGWKGCRPSHFTKPQKTCKVRTTVPFYQSWHFWNRMSTTFLVCRERTIRLITYYLGTGCHVIIEVGTLLCFYDDIILGNTACKAVSTTFSICSRHSNRGHILCTPYTLQSCVQVNFGYKVLSEKFHRGWLRFENITIDYGFTLFDDIEQPMAKQPVPEEEEDIMVRFEISQQFHCA